MLNSGFYLFLIFIVLYSSSPASTMKYAGARSSDYGISPFPTTSEWNNVMHNMASYFPGSTPTGVWIVGTIDGSNCVLEFPVSGSYSHVVSSSTDKHEPYLSYFDTHGIKVLLQVESGLASVDTLIKIVMNRYGSHSCVIGFGIDVEWYNSSGNQNTSYAVTDARAQAWQTRIKSYNSSFKLVLKHWLTGLMPPTFRGDIIFLDDSQAFPSLNDMTDEFKVWADYFPNNDVMFQIGYDDLIGSNNDYYWWKNLTIPPKAIGDAIQTKITAPGQNIGVAWVDFTLRYSELDLFDPVSLPPTPTLVSPANNATNVATNPTFSWNSVTGATSYRIQVSLVSNFTTTVIDQSGLTAVTYSAGGLSNNTQYYWRVCATNSIGSGPWSSSRNFTTTSGTPSAPTLSSPLDNATAVFVTPTLSWNTSTGATSYGLQVSTASNFNPVLIDHSGLATISDTTGSLAYNTHYYWHVNASNANGTGGWSGTWSFTTEKQGQTILFSPLADKTYGDVDFDPGATATSGLTVTYSSSNSSVATIVANKVHITGCGTSTIYADQAGNSQYNPAQQVSRVITVNKASATITLGNLTHTYDGTAKSATATTSPTGLTVSITYTLSGTTATPLNAGSYSAAATINSSNYQGGTSGTLTIAKAPLIVSTGNTGRTYGAANPLFTVAYSGFVNGENKTVLTIEPFAACTVSQSTPVGSYPIVAGGGEDENYSFSYTNGALAITKALLSVFAENAGRTYGAANPLFTVTYSGFVNGENKTVLATEPFASCTASQTTPVGSYPIVPGGGDDENYSFSYTSGALTITKALLSVSAGNASRSYGAMNPSFTVAYSGFVNGENKNVLATEPFAACTASQITPVGSYPIAPGGGNDENYSFSFNDGVLTVTKASLSVSADNKTRPYNTANPLLTVSYSGFVNGDDEADLAVMPIAATGASASSPAGEYPITVSGGDDENYSLNNIEGVLTITKVTAHITLSALIHTYDGSQKAATAVTSPSGLPVTVIYEQNDTVVTPVNAGVYVLEACITDTNYQGTAVDTLHIKKADQIISFAPLQNKTPSDPDFDPGATASSSLAVVYTSSDTTVATIEGNKIHIVAVGSTVIVAQQPGNNNYNAAQSVGQTLVIDQPVSIVITTDKDAMCKVAVIPQVISKSLNQTCSIQIPSNKPLSNLTCIIYDPTGNVLLKDFYKRLYPDSHNRVILTAWDGTNRQNRKVSEGMYVVIVRFTDGKLKMHFDKKLIGVIK